MEALCDCQVFVATSSFKEASSSAPAFMQLRGSLGSSHTIDLRAAGLTLQSDQVRLGNPISDKIRQLLLSLHHSPQENTRIACTDQATCKVTCQGRPVLLQMKPVPGPTALTIKPTTAKLWHSAKTYIKA